MARDDLPGAEDRLLVALAQNNVHIAVRDADIPHSVVRIPPVDDEAEAFEGLPSPRLACVTTRDAPVRRA